MVRVDTTFGGSLSAGAAAPRLSPRQLVVLQLLARSYTRRQVADLLDVGVDEVGRHVISAAGALGVSTASEAVLSAQRHRLID
jgi:DNA-binding NarL/FixJ family response regulator